MKLALIGAAILGFHGPAQPCPTQRAVLTAGAPTLRYLPCAGNVTPYVYVNGEQLVVADLSHRGTTATFYGMGSVVRVVQADSRIRILGVTVYPRTRLVVRFTRS